MQASALLLRWGSYRRACNVRVLIVNFFSLLCCTLCFQSSAQIRQWEVFLVIGNFSLFKTPFLGRNSVPPSFVSFFVFYIFSYLLWKSWVAFLGAWCPLSAFRSCFVEFTRRLNALLMNLWGRKCSPHPTPPPSWLLSPETFLSATNQFHVFDWRIGRKYINTIVWHIYLFIFVLLYLLLSVSCLKSF